MALTRAPRKEAPWPPSNPFRRERVVRPGESLVSIAHEEQIDESELLLFNFQTTHPEEVNWYLGHKLHCKAQTHDGKNYVFSGGETIYIPKEITVPSFGKQPKIPSLPAETAELAHWTPAERIGEAMRRSLHLIPSESRAEVEALLTPQSLAIIGGMTTAWGVSHFFGVGEVADVIVVGLGAICLGKAAVEVARDMNAFVNLALDAKTSADLDRSSEHFAMAVATVGVNVIVALLLHKASGRIKARLRKSSNPIAKRIFYRPPVTGDPALPPGEGLTNKYGDVTYSTQGSAADQAIARNHELVHSWLSPKLKFLRTFRADIGMGAYQKSQFLRYLEEALAETYAQVKARGASGLPDGIKFPMNGGYSLTLKGVMTEAAIGTVVVGGTMYVVYVYASE